MGDDLMPGMPEHSKGLNKKVINKHQTVNQQQAVLE